MFQIETSAGHGQRCRHKLILDVEADGRDPMVEPVTIIYTSETGMLIEANSQLTVGEMIEVHLPQAGLREAKIVWVGGDIYGCRFMRPLTPSAFNAAQLGGRFELIKPNSKRQLCALSERRGDFSNAKPLNNPLSLGAKMGIIFGLALSLWVTIGATAYWIMT